MKGMLKALLWILFGGGIGFFIGERVGERMANKEEAETMNAEEAGGNGDFQEPQCRMTESDYEELRRKYSGDFVEAAKQVRIEFGLTDKVPEPEKAKEGDMDGDIPVLPKGALQWTKEDCPPPMPITEQEYYNNPDNFDQEELLYYTDDEVLYNVTTREVEVAAEIIGEHATDAFCGDPNNPVETIYIQNTIHGTLYKIDRIDDAFCDETDPSGPPEGDEFDDEE